VFFRIYLANGIIIFLTVLCENMQINWPLVKSRHFSNCTVDYVLSLLAIEALSLFLIRKGHWDIPLFSQKRSVGDGICSRHLAWPKPPLSFSCLFIYRGK